MSKQKAQHALVWFANMMMQIPEYQPSWGPAFCVTEALAYKKKLEEYLSQIDFTQMTVEELKELGFRWWDEEHTLLLCPLWLASLFPSDDHDHRGGCLAFGFKVKDGKITRQTGVINGTGSSTLE